MGLDFLKGITVDEHDIRRLLDSVSDGSLTIDAAVKALKVLPVQTSGEIKHDSHRPLRRGLIEAVFAPGKSPQQLVDAVKAAVATGDNCLVTRVSQVQADMLIPKFESYNAAYNATARMVTILQKPVSDLGRGQILVVSAGTADQPVAEEAAITCSTLGNRTRRIFDVGVAGLHRILEVVDDIQNATVIIVVAGMEGALAGVVAGLAPCPVIGVPTSIGYGTSFGGIAPLLAMLNSCAGGLSVVNIDNGFGAALTATLINRKRVVDAPPEP